MFRKLRKLLRSRLRAASPCRVTLSISTMELEDRQTLSAQGVNAELREKAVPVSAGINNTRRTTSPTRQRDSP